MSKADHKGIFLFVLMWPYSHFLLLFMLLPIDLKIIILEKLSRLLLIKESLISASYHYPQKFILKALDCKRINYLVYFGLKFTAGG